MSEHEEERKALTDAVALFLIQTGCSMFAVPTADKSRWMCFGTEDFIRKCFDAKGK